METHPERHTPSHEPSQTPGATRRYEAPRLLVLGDVRSLILGGSPGTGDSANPYIQRAPAG